MKEEKKLIDRLCGTHSLSLEEYARLIGACSPELADYAAKLADPVRRRYYDNTVFVRGLIEVGNDCCNDCLYCGLRRSNENADRYLLTSGEILACCEEGYQLGYRTFVLQGGERMIPVEQICEIVLQIRRGYPDCAITLSFGEYEYDEYRQMRLAGADRYLLRHETADREHYEKLHPQEMSFAHRMQCLTDLHELGFQVGCGFMVGSPYQTEQTLAKDLKFVETFSPEMCGIGPFIPQKDTPMGAFPAGSVELTLYLLSLIRLIKPNILLPATTALGTLAANGRERGIKAGANVVMPNLSPVGVRKKYAIYDNKICTGDESAQCRHCLENRMRSVGYRIVTARGDMAAAN